MFREIRTSERITDRFEEQRRLERENYRKIKPERKMSIEEVDAFWEAEFQRAHDEAMASSQEA